MSGEESGHLQRWAGALSQRRERVRLWIRDRSYAVRQWWGRNWRPWTIGLMLALGWGLGTWALVELAVWAVGLLGWPRGPVPGIVWKGSAAALILGLIGRRMLSQLFGYGPILLDEIDQEESSGRARR